MGTCKKCEVPFSTNGTRVFCLYCGFSKDSKVKQQYVMYRTDGVTTLFKIPTFNRVHFASIVIEVDEMPLPFQVGYGIEQVRSETFVKMPYALAPGHKIRIEWEDFKG